MESEINTTTNKKNVPIQGYKPSTLRLVIYYSLCLCTFGILLIIKQVLPILWTKLTHQKCPLSQACKVIVEDTEGDFYVENIHQIYESNLVPSYFYHKKIKYEFFPQSKTFIQVKGFDNIRIDKLKTFEKGRTLESIKSLLSHYGLNSIKIDITPIYLLFYQTATKPFYIYQVFMITVWIFHNYIQFSICVMTFSLFSIIFNIYETRKQKRQLRNKVCSESLVFVIRNSKISKISSSNLVPGDVLVHFSGKSHVMECDSVLIDGYCSVDESILTGESNMILKTPLRFDIEGFYSPSTHSQNTLFHGTKVVHIQPRRGDYAKSIVVRTGFMTAKGELVRAILYPKSKNKMLQSDLLKNIILFFIITAPVMIFSAYCFMRFETSFQDVLAIVIIVATFVVPPMLPAVMTYINSNAQKRLRKEGLYCLNSDSIFFAGNIDMICFDKTGTLTEDNVDLSWILPSFAGKFKNEIIDIMSLTEATMIKLSMITCHTLMKREEELDGDLLDVRMFQATGWQIIDNVELKFSKNRRIFGPRMAKNLENLYEVIKEYPFEATLQRTAVIAKKIDNSKCFFIVKGSPEKIKSFCQNNSIPEDFDHVLQSYTSKGCRVLATASLLLNPSQINLKRNELERDLHFDGLIVFENKLKSETTQVINKLNQAGLRNVIITGDNIFTALSIAFQSNIISAKTQVVEIQAAKHLPLQFRYINENNGVIKSNKEIKPLINQDNRVRFIINGKSLKCLRKHHYKYFYKVLEKGSVFARMTPDDKLSLIEDFQNFGYKVAMCGDGANDCGALSAANIGISLSVGEASVASPFTSKANNIQCVDKVLREGRNTVSITLDAFKYISCYTFALLMATTFLIWEGNMPADGCYLIIDIGLNILIPLLMGTYKPVSQLAKKKPPVRLFTFSTNLSIFGFICIQGIIYYIGRWYLINETWYQPYHFNSTKGVISEPTQMSYTIMGLNFWSYIIASIIFATRSSFRRGFFSNQKYVLLITFNSFIITSILVYPSPKLILNYVKFSQIPFDFKLRIFSLSLLNFGISYALEHFFFKLFVLKLKRFIQWSKTSVKKKSKQSRFQKRNLILLKTIQRQSKL